MTCNRAQVARERGVTTIAATVAGDCIWLVVNSITPYGYEAAKVVGLPEGAIYRGRFSKEWVSPRANDALPQIAGRAGLLFFRDFSTGRIFPLRHIKIRSAKWLGSILSIEYETGSFWSLDDDAARRTQQVDAYKTWWLEQQKTEVRGGGPADDLFPLVTIGPYPAVTPNVRPSGTFDVAVSNWRNLAEELAQSSDLAAYPFVLVNLQGNPDGTDAHMHNGHIDVHRNGVRMIELISHFRRSPSGQPTAAQRPLRSIRVSATIDRDVFQISSTEVVLAGGYDVGRLSISARGAGRGSLVLRPQIPGPIPEYDNAITLPLAAKTTSAMLFASGAALAASLLLYFAPTFGPIVLFHTSAELARLGQDLSLVGAATSLTFFLIELNSLRGQR